MSPALFIDVKVSGITIGLQALQDNPLKFTIELRRDRLASSGNLSKR